jgi:carbamoyl-phosphate synthase/aspartate carbamoyltransferase/dihydroorotase
MTTLRLPGLIDIHTHLRVPGGEHKEDFASGTAAALAGGVTMVLGMPNTNPPLSTLDALHAARAAARRAARCDVGLFAGAAADDLDELPDLAPFAVGLKIYLNDTFGRLRIDQLPALVACFERWPADRLIALHAEQQSVATAIGLAAIVNRPIHIVHVSRREEIALIAAAKQRGLPVTCEVAPHHLFMDQRDAARMGPLADMRPVLGTPDDVAALWEHIDETVDCIATDHAPHTLAEKFSPNPPPGISGLETSLLLMLTAMSQGRITEKRLIALMHDNPRRLFNLPEQPDTYVLVDLDQTTRIENSRLQTKCGWTPFDGRELIGRIERVVLRGQTAFADGCVLAPPGSGRLIPA